MPEIDYSEQSNSVSSISYLVKERMNKKIILEKINHESHMITNLIKKLNLYILYFW